MQYVHVQAGQAFLIILICTEKSKLNMGIKAFSPVMLL